MDRTKVLDSVTTFYLESHDFNGYPVYKLKEDYRLSDREAKVLIEELVSSGQVDVTLTGNTHIKPFNIPDTTAQIAAWKPLSSASTFAFTQSPRIFPSYLNSRNTMIGHTPKLSRWGKDSWNIVPSTFPCSNITATIPDTCTRLTRSTETSLCETPFTSPAQWRSATKSFSRLWL